MTEWNAKEIEKVGSAEELSIAGMQADGTLRKAVIIWVVRVGDGLYVRSYKGRGAGWFRGVLEKHQGRIWAGGVEKAVRFVEETNPSVLDQVDAAYRAKYARYPQYVAPMLTAEVRSTTLRLAGN